MALIGKTCDEGPLGAETAQFRWPKGLFNKTFGPDHALAIAFTAIRLE